MSENTLMLSSNPSAFDGGARLTRVDLWLDDGRCYELDARSIEKCEVESRMGYNTMVELRVTLVVRVYPGLRVRKSWENQDERQDGSEAYQQIQPPAEGD